MYIRYLIEGSFLIMLNQLKLRSLCFFSVFGTSRMVPRHRDEWQSSEWQSAETTPVANIIKLF